MSRKPGRLRSFVFEPHTFIGMSGLKQSFDNNLKSIVGVAAAAIGAGALYFYSKQKKSCCCCSSCSCG